MATLDNFYALKFIRILTQKWEDTDAFKHGIIDKKGNVLKKFRSLQGEDEKRAYNRFVKLVFSLKKMLEKVPFASSTLGRYTTALALIKEECGEYFEDELKEHLLATDSTLTEAHLREFNGTGGVDGGASGLLPLNRRKHGLGEDVGDDLFAGAAIFDCDSDTFLNCRLGKKKYHQYKNIVGESEAGERIRVYGLKNPQKEIILRDSGSGGMRYLRRRGVNI